MCIRPYFFSDLIFCQIDGEGGLTNLAPECPDNLRNILNCRQDNTSDAQEASPSRCPSILGSAHKGQQVDGDQESDEEVAPNHVGNDQRKSPLLGACRPVQFLRNFFAGWVVDQEKNKASRKETVVITRRFVSNQYGHSGSDFIVPRSLVCPNVRISSLSRKRGVAKTYTRPNIKN